MTDKNNNDGRSLPCSECGELECDCDDWDEEDLSREDELWFFDFKDE